MPELLPCRHRPPCPGCPRYGDPGISHRAKAALDAYCAQHGLPSAEVVSGQMTGYRQRAKLAVRGHWRAPRIGLFREGSHEVVHAPTCPIHAAGMNRLVSQVRHAMVRVRARPYSDDAHAGLVRYLQVVRQRSDATFQLTLVTNSKQPTPARQLLSEIESSVEDVSGLFWNGQHSRLNRVFGGRFLHIAGRPAVEERVAGARVFFPPGAFGQANLDLFEQIAEQVRSWVGEQQRVVELYSGVGAIGLGLLKSNHVVFNELSPHGIAGLRLGIAALPEDHRERAAVIEGDAAAAARAVDAADVVIVDPPRRGLTADTIAAVVALRPAVLLYVSCGFEALLADSQALSEAGYVVADCRAYNLLPFTDHVETLVRFRMRV